MSTALIGFDLTRVYTDITPVGGYPPAPKLGQVYEDAIGNKYKFVKSPVATAFVIGDFVAYYYTNAAKTEVATPATGNLASMAGVVMGTVTAVISFFWIQYRGLGSGKVTGSASNAAGTSLKLTNAAGVAAVFDAAVDTAPAFPNYAACTAAQASTVVASVLLNCNMGV